MSIAALVRRLSELGASAEMIATAVDAVEEVEAKDAERRAKRAAQKAKEREASSCTSVYLVYGVTETDWYRLRGDVFQRDGFKCVYCGSDGGGASLQCDHVVPWSRGGATALENLATACRPCNASKRDRTPDEWGRQCQ